MKKNNAVIYVRNQLGCSTHFAREIIGDKETKKLAIKELTNLIEVIKTVGVKVTL